MSKGRLWSAKEERLFAKLVAQGVRGKDIAARLGRSLKSIRGRASLLKCADIGPAFDTFLHAKHALGWSDAEISRAWKCDRHAVAIRRRQLGLPLNMWTEHRRRRVAAKTREQLAKAGLSSMAELRLKTWRDRAKALGWPVNLRPREVDVLEALWQHGPMTRWEIARAIGWNTIRKDGRPKNQRNVLHDGGASKTFPETRGGYLANLMARGLVIRSDRREIDIGAGKTDRLSRQHRRKVFIYSLPLHLERRTA